MQRLEYFFIIKQSVSRSIVHTTNTGSWQTVNWVLVKSYKRNIQKGNPYLSVLLPKLYIAQTTGPQTGQICMFSMKDLPLELR